jgi:hypothetical protein
MKRRIWQDGQHRATSLKNKLDFEGVINYLSPCGIGRAVGPGEGYFKAPLMLKRFQKIGRTNQTDAENLL